ncbi:putative het domain-containing protein [Phaeoacremonium minimum UCRPA7]|uniref:Putative het domain-containing protein n=1 Tax=Phaeoacremonium minimum (strain UCR-PA7) TaxID=1286976 RepID=R8BT22_PHAM7|nr:putative het domain-containing protein [Phaeoacremonium minimum UCRPA7]EOO02454.1 putative het domain-containing protein [Phaeoacremonium minimum UCRPA7]
MILRSATRDIQLISLWLSECQQGHAMCQQLITPVLPKRVLDVGSANNDPHLVISSEATGRYLCLSHRWGSDQEQLCTTKESLPHFCETIPFGSFPLLFQQAIEVTRALDVQYLWIDSLCILQDDVEDWERESALMGDIYSNAYATLFAERATNSNDSLFQTDDDRGNRSHFVQDVEHKDPATGQTHSILVASKLATYPSSLEEAFCLVDQSESHLEDRGWVLQEEVLSRRKICFSHTELHWQCNVLSQCECGMRSVMASNTVSCEHDFVSRLLLFHRSDGTVTKGLSKSLSSARRRTMDVNRAWQQLVRAYCLRNLTTEQDRLSALAGVASRLGRSKKNIEAEWKDGLYRYQLTAPGEADCITMRIDADDNGPITEGLRRESMVITDTAEDWNDIRASLGIEQRKYLYLIAGLRSQVNDLTHLGVTLTEGLLLRESRRQPEFWERVCLMKPDGWWREWEKLTMSRTLVLI